MFLRIRTVTICGFIALFLCLPTPLLLADTLENIRELLEKGSYDDAGRLEPHLSGSGPGEFRAVALGCTTILSFHRALRSSLEMCIWDMSIRSAIYLWESSLNNPRFRISFSR